MALVFCLPVLANGDGELNNYAYVLPRYDEESGIIVASVVFFGDAVSALGVTLEYNSDMLDYTGYARGDGFLALEVLATLENSGRVNILTYGADARGCGEVIKLFFKLKDRERSQEIKFNLLPLTAKPAGVIDGSAVREVPVCFLFGKINIYSEHEKIAFCDLTEYGELVLSVATDREYTICLSVIELSGKIRQKTVTASACGGKFSLDICEIKDGYTSVIIEPYYFENDEKIYVEREILLFYRGKYIG